MFDFKFRISQKFGLPSFGPSSLHLAFSIFFPPVLFSKKLDKRFVAGVLLVILLLRPTLCSSDASSVFTNFPAFGSVIFKNSAALIFPFMAISFHLVS